MKSMVMSANKVNRSMPEGAAKRSSWLPDPRAILLAVMVINAVALSSGSTKALFASVVFTALCLLTVNARFCCVFLAIFWVFYCSYLGLLAVGRSTTAAFAAVVFLWFSRYTVSIGIGAVALLTLTPSALNAALRQLRLPIWIVLPLVVFVRIAPVIMAEAKAINEAMRLRGMKLGFARAVEAFVIPLLSAVMRVGDELAAAALVRGLGSKYKPTTTFALRFSVVDALVVTALIGIVALASGMVK